MGRISHRVAAIEESATLAISARAAALRAEGRPVIGFGAGEPDFPTPPHIVEAAQRACADPRFHKYTATAGLPELRAAIAERSTESAFEVEPSQVVVTNGGKQAVFEALATLIDPGDEVLVTAPYWVTYPEAVALAGGTTVPVPTSAASGYLAAIDQLEAATTPGPSCSSSSRPPTQPGPSTHPTTWPPSARGPPSRGLWVLTDEIYARLVYGDATFTSIPVAAPEGRPQTVVVSGVAKSYAMTGWRVGWIIAPNDVAAAAANLQSHLSSNVANVAQAAALAALTGPQDEVEAMREAFDRRRRTAYSMLSKVPDMECPEPLGAFYLFPSVAGVLERGVGGRHPATSLELCALLLDQAEVAVVPGEAFGTPGAFRLSYALGDTDLEEGLSRLVSTLSEV